MRTQRDMVLPVSLRLRRRDGFTLLEMMVATAIAVLLLAALYVALDLQVRHASAARDVIHEATLARSLMNRMAVDLSSSLGMADPSRYQPADSATASTTTSTTDPATAATDPATGMTDPTAEPTVASSFILSTGPRLFSVQGDSMSLTLCITRLPPGQGRMPLDPSAVPPIAGDLRQIHYWLAGGPDAALGLARQEITLVMSDEASNSLPEITDPNDPLILAPEVQSLAFSYFDGTSWTDTWDATLVGSDGVTPVGPPTAVAITIGLVPPGTPAGSGVEPRYYRHVVAIMTANGLPSTTTTTAGTTTSPTGGTTTTPTTP